MFCTEPDVKSLLRLQHAMGDPQRVEVQRREAGGVDALHVAAVHAVRIAVTVPRLRIHAELHRQAQVGGQKGRQRTNLGGINVDVAVEESGFGGVCGG